MKSIKYFVSIMLFGILFFGCVNTATIDIKSIALDPSSYQGNHTIVGIWSPAFSMYGYHSGYIYSDDMLYKISAIGNVPPSFPKNCNGYGRYSFTGELKNDTFYIATYTLLECVPTSKILNLLGVTNSQ